MLPPVSAIKTEFLKKLHSPSQLERLYEYLPDVFFFVKNMQGQFIMGNKLFIQKCGVNKEADIIGKTDYDFFPKDRAESYVKDDKYVMETGEDVVNRVELAPEKDGAINWFITSKVPLYSKSDEIIGMAGIARDCRRSLASFNQYFEMSNVLEHIRDNYQQNIEIKTLASMCSLSISQFERKFKKTFHITPLKHINNVRLNAATQLLKTTNMTISTIAQESGFYDHSHFTRLFTKHMGITPKEYRKKIN